MNKDTRASGTYVPTLEEGETPPSVCAYMTRAAQYATCNNRSMPIFECQTNGPVTNPPIILRFLDGKNVESAVARRIVR